jgi:DNA-binding MarR family transcriptional regulator
MIKKTNAIDLETYVPALINILSTKLSSSASATYRDRFDLGVVEWRILVLLARKSGLSATQVRAIVGQDKAPISRALRELEQKKLIRIQQAPKGHRLELTITTAGRSIYRASIPVAMRREEVLLQNFTDEERVVLTDFLKRMISRSDDVATLASKDLPK